MKDVNVKDFIIGKNQPLTFICGPCVIEDEEHTLNTAKFLKDIFSGFSFNFIFKASFDKANRLSINSFRGPGLEKGLNILKRVKDELDLPIITDIHEPHQAKIVAEVCDVIQIPAFLCRQTDLLIAAGKTGCAINIKKGQFMAPWDMQNIVEKLLSTDNNKIILTDRGTSFGYNNLVSDMRAIPIMQQFGFPVCFDASHSTQLPGGLGATTGGQSQFIPILAKSAVVSGCNALFIEAHPHPKKAKSDSTTVMAFEDLQLLLKDIEKLYNAIS